MQNPSMADNVLRIVFDGDGGGGGPGESPYGPFKPNPFSPESTMGFRQRYGEPSAAAQSFDPAAIAARRLENEQKQIAIQREFNLQKFGTFGGSIANASMRLGLPNPVSGLAGRGAAMLGPLGLLGGLGIAAGLAGFHQTQGLADKHANLGFSPDVAIAKGAAEVSRTQRDIRESQVLGPSLAKFMEAQTKIQEVIADLLLPIKEFVVNTMASILQAIAEAMTVIRDVMVELKLLAQPKPGMDMVDDFFRIGGAGGAAAFGLDGIGGAAPWKAHGDAKAIADFIKNLNPARLLLGF